MALLVIDFACLPNDLHSMRLANLAQTADDGVIDRTGAQTAANDENGLLIGVNPHGLTGLLGSGATVQQIAPDGVTR